jgi:hypothetical protein
VIAYFDDCTTSDIYWDSSDIAWYNFNEEIKKFVKALQDKEAEKARRTKLGVGFAKAYHDNLIPVIAPVIERKLYQHKRFGYNRVPTRNFYKIERR